MRLLFWPSSPSAHQPHSPHGPWASQGGGEVPGWLRPTTAALGASHCLQLRQRLRKIWALPSGSLPWVLALYSPGMSLGVSAALGPA